MKYRCSGCSGVVTAHHWTIWVGRPWTPSASAAWFACRPISGNEAEGFAEPMSAGSTSLEQLLMACPPFSGLRPTLSSSAHDVCTSPRPLSLRPGVRVVGSKRVSTLRLQPHTDLELLSFLCFCILGLGMRDILTWAKPSPISCSVMNSQVCMGE